MLYELTVDELTTSLRQKWTISHFDYC